MLIDFCSNPTPPEEKKTHRDLEEPDWMPVTATHMKYMHITGTLQMDEDPYPERTLFWDEITRSYNMRNQQKLYSAPPLSNFAARVN